MKKNLFILAKEYVAAKKTEVNTIKQLIKNFIRLPPFLINIVIHLNSLENQLRKINRHGQIIRKTLTAT